MRIALAGGGRLAVHMLTALLDSDHEVVALVQNARQAKGWRRAVYPRIGRFFGMGVSVTGIALREGIPIVWIDQMTEEELAPLRALEIDLLLVGGFAIILKKPLLELPRVGCLNCHSSLLPRNRGPNPFAGAILDGDTETGISFHVMDEGIDTGAIVRQFAIPIEPTDNAASLYINTSILAGQEVVATIDQVAREGLTGAPQDESQATYLKKMKKADCFIDWKQTAIEIERLVRACYPFQMARFRWRGKVVYLARCSLVEYEGEALPGTVVETSPRVCVSTSKGAVRVDFAYTTRPFVFAWPPLIGRPRQGDTMDARESAS